MRRVRSSPTLPPCSESRSPHLVAALRNPTRQFVGETQCADQCRRNDEVAKLARSFSALHGTLVDVLVSRWTSSGRASPRSCDHWPGVTERLVEPPTRSHRPTRTREEDPESSAAISARCTSHPHASHAESLLVSGVTDTKRIVEKPLDHGDVVRAALGEVDDYQRIEVLALEPVQVSGGVVTDLSHLLSEILDNATQFSPPADRVRVTGLFDQEGYLLTISDHGVGMTETRMGEINRLLAKPPVLGLALDPTLGLYVVARLAARHGIDIRLVRGVPGMTVRVTLPRNKLEVATQPLNEGPGREDAGDSRHSTVSRDNGAGATTERRRVHQRTSSTHDRDANGERTPSGPAIRSVGADT